MARKVPLTCKCVIGCGRPAWARGICRNHWRKAKNEGWLVDVPKSAIPNGRPGGQVCRICGRPMHAKGLCLRHYRAQWRSEHPEAREPARIASLEYAAAHRERQRERDAASIVERATRKARRRSLEVGAPGHATAEQIQARIDFYGGLCAYCRKRPFEHLDHVIPLSRGGSNWPANLRPACRWCNISKRDRKLSEWRSP